MNRIPIRWRLSLGYAAMLALLVLVATMMVVTTPWWHEGDADDFRSQQQDGEDVAIRAVRESGFVNLTTSSSLTIEGPRHAELTGSMVPVSLVGSMKTGNPGLDVIGPASVVVFHRRDGHVSFQSFSGTTLSAGVPVQRSASLPPAVSVRSAQWDLPDGISLPPTGSAEGPVAGMFDLLPIIAIAIPLLLLVMAAGYVLSGRALRPLARMTSLVSTIGAKDLHARLNLDLPDDEIGQLAQTLDGMLERVQRGYDNQAQFAGNAAHELRTPLTSMRALIDLTLTRARTTDEYRDAITQLDVDLGRLTSLVETLLALARAENGQLELDMAHFDLGATIQSVVEMFQHQEDAATVDMRVRIDPVELAGDEDLIVQVLVNLIDNACRHTGAGGSVTVSCQREDDWAVVRVADTGTGIAPEHVDRVFERFYRADSDHRRGAGLGLAITRAIVERHGGSIFLRSEQGAGTVVEVRLPVDGVVA